MMEIIKQYPEDLGKRTCYKMMRSPEIKKMMDADGSILELTAWVLYSDTDENTGDMKEVLSVMTADGELFGTISATFIKDFKEIAEYFGADIGNIKVISGKSKNGRTYITCSVED